MTTFGRVFEVFLDKVEDGELAILLTKNQPAAEANMRGLLESASVEFYKYAIQKGVNLDSQRDDTVEGRGYFLEELPLQAIHLLADGMLVHWYKRQMSKQKLIQQTITDSEFKQSEGFRILRSMLPVYEKLKSEVRQEMIDSTWR